MALLLSGAMKCAACFCSIVLTLLTTSGCSGDTPTSPSSTDTTPGVTAASPTYSEEFVDTIPVSGSVFYSFTVTQYGTVNVSLTSISGQYVPSTVTVGLAMGKPEAETCVPVSSISTQAGTGPQLTGTVEAGVNCVKVSDVGNLYSPAAFAVTIAYP